MKEIEEYITLYNEIETCEFRIGILRQDETDKYELAEMKRLKTKYEAEISPLREVLRQENVENADSIRLGYISIFNHYLDGFTASQRIGKSLDLNQGMINPGYLLGMIIHDLNGVLISVGDIVAMPYLMASNYKWEDDLLFEIIKSYRQKILNRQFLNILEAVDFYYQIRDSIRDLINKLRIDRVIS
ncbi:hypothetical protein BEL04_00020 [Mucilaginibacter sp. PPCGB 2223]|uniref:hypothetical protein n=1 Tax=Mucilaginibacter sp. PPCGB 2223 TaxID=1886027 RepID=UPI0008262D98|nr:hypothetical protein [Mucilaginibacter sp. PPCGB 2223]OCX52760.1 hypothetical protein BEL04_00020 [Mucilaginibacter sp. PPCGB 2223]